MQNMSCQRHRGTGQPTNVCSKIVSFNSHHSAVAIESLTGECWQISKQKLATQLKPTFALAIWSPHFLSQPKALSDREFHYPNNITNIFTNRMVK
jgi:hypothetical protein